MKRVFTQTFGVVGAILEKDGKILLVQETKEDIKGKWSDPGGWIDMGEDPVESVKREIKEETGYDFEPTHILGIYSLHKKEGKDIHHAIKIIFTGNILGEQSKELHHDVSATKWFTPEEIYEMGDILRDVDVKDMVKRYFKGEKYSLDLLIHTRQNI